MRQGLAPVGTDVLGLGVHPSRLQPRRHEGAEHPLPQHVAPTPLVLVAAGGADQAHHVRLETLSCLIVEAVVPRTKEGTHDGRSALRVIGEGLAGDVGDSLHHAGTAGERVVRALGEAQGLDLGESVGVDAHHGSSAVMFWMDSGRGVTRSPGNTSRPPRASHRHADWHGDCLPIARFSWNTPTD